jgi:hypothetical protein
MEHLIMAMADAYNSKGKTTLFGNDKGLKAYKKFEEKFRDVLLALHLDRLIGRTASSGEYLETFVAVLQEWAETFPNWEDAYTFALELLRDEGKANSMVAMLIGVKNQKK